MCRKKEPELSSVLTSWAPTIKEPVRGNIEDYMHVITFQRYQHHA